MDDYGSPIDYNTSDGYDDEDYSGFTFPNTRPEAVDPRGGNYTPQFTINAIMDGAMLRDGETGRIFCQDQNFNGSWDGN